MITASQALYIVRERIEEIRSAKAAWKELAANPRSTGDQRLNALRAFQTLENQFAWQWRNVERILQECLKEGIE